ARVLCRSSQTHPVDLSREELMQRLRSADDIRKGLMTEVNPEEIWELAQDTPDTGFDVSFLAELSFGETAEDDHNAAFLRCIFVDKLFFKYKEGKIIAHSKEVVEQLRLQQEKERQKEALLENGARGMRSLWEGKNPGEWPEKEKCIDLVRDYYLFANDAPESALGRELLKKAELTRPHDPYHFLIKAGVWDRNENIPLLRYEMPQEFSEEALAQAGSLHVPDVDHLIAEGRRDFRELPLLTIDGSQTKDYDDALHILKKGENFEVGIHIADVAHYVKPGSPLYQEALQRVTSLYFPDAMVPMLPPEISEDLCSLIAGRERLALSYLVMLSPEGEVLDFSIVRSVVTVKRQLTYVESDLSIEKDEELRSLFQLGQKLLKKRIDDGAVLLPIPDVIIQIDADEEISVSLSPVDTPSRSLVAEFMVLANTLAARFIADREAPGLFRSQQPPGQRLVQGLEKDLFVNFRQRKHLAPGKLLTVPKHHSGVGVAQYTTVTSPIRRLLDLVMQHQLNHLAQRETLPFAVRDLNDVAAAIMTRQSKANLVRQLRRRHWLLKCIEKKKNERFDALILGKGPKRVNVVLTDFLLEGDLPANQAITARPGDMVSVGISRVSALDNVLRLEW
ncbi:MAG: RNB domain-containing ribonuclease, partial [Desulfobulbaceae bacterium]|nr:RNB domain-containing ribonuclease [Desulfobulbaceae bacterium]